MRHGRTTYWKRRAIESRHGIIGSASVVEFHVKVDNVVVIGGDAVKGFDITVGGEKVFERVRNDTSICICVATIVVDSSKDLSLVV